MIPAYKKKMTVAGVIFLATCVAVAAIAAASNPREPGLATKVVPLLGLSGAIALLVTFWAYVKAKGRSGRWILVLVPLSFFGLVILAFLTDRVSVAENGVASRRELRRMFAHILLSSAQLVVALICVFSFYLGWILWEGRQLKSLCAEANEGVAVSALPALAEKYGFARHWVEHGIRDANGSGRVTYVPSSSTMGEFACAIHYNDTRVLWAKVE